MMIGKWKIIYKKFYQNTIKIVEVVTHSQTRILIRSIDSSIKEREKNPKYTKVYKIIILRAPQ